MELTPVLDTRPIVYFSANFGHGEPVQDFTVAQRGTTVLITDRTESMPACWDRVIRTPWETLGISPRRASRSVKLSPELWFPHAAASVWFDATNVPIVDLAQLIDSAQPDTVISCFRHPCRTMMSEEITACLEFGLDTPQLLTGFAEFCKSVGFADRSGLYGTACVARRHTPETAALNSLWRWAVNRWSMRDQVSLPWVLSTLGLVPGCLHGLPRPTVPIVGEASVPNPYFSVTLWPDERPGV
jgi:hypothetical protein